ncbi:GNAT family N-acetyltransferase [Janthinobacterium aquaticum]|uniref:GNAT family N-acetyltransferase n=1 Tax=Janthinobacterium sp. FT58W TaxID=2654254 RepID=UPI00126503A5|nr:GNAT family N-acetyltransferase [Janthinobacterium sp. FT58W]KAB8041156.1 GNAT family N-acetyltransferase [Janthinobacterium sp. FT58W]
MPDILITADSASSVDALLLQDELSGVLLRMNGDSGRASFDIEAPCVRGGFYIARDAAGALLGCAALRPLGDDASPTAELKRMYARPGSRGVGAALLAFVEAQAAAHGYRQVQLSTRRINLRAVDFYARHGYVEVAPYGKYVSAPQSVCMGKALPD